MSPRPAARILLRRLWCGALALPVILSLVLSDEAFAQRSSGLQMTPDSSVYLISKDVGSERWSISFNLADRTVTGNVFNTDGSPPSFIWCEMKSSQPSADPARNSYTLDCYGSTACAAAPCGGAEWSLIASDLVVQGSFLLPAGTRSTLSGNVQPILDRSCAFADTCHAAEGAGRLDLASGLSWRSTFRVPARQAADPSIFYIDPFRLESSYLVKKIMGTGLGSQMPLGGQPLPQGDMDAIVNWILEGAVDN